MPIVFVGLMIKLVTLPMLIQVLVAGEIEEGWLVFIACGGAGFVLVLFCMFTS